MIALSFKTVELESRLNSTSTNSPQEYPAEYSPPNGVPALVTLQSGTQDGRSGNRGCKALPPSQSSSITFLALETIAAPAIRVYNWATDSEGEEEISIPG